MTSKTSPDASGTPSDAKNTPDNTRSQPASSQGMPDRDPREQGARTGRQDTPKDGAIEASLELPSDRDQSSGDMTAAPGEGPDQPKVEQAGRDAGSDLKDTSKAPEMDRTYKKL